MQFNPGRPEALEERRFRAGSGGRHVTPNRDVHYRGGPRSYPPSRSTRQLDMHVERPVQREEVWVYNQIMAKEVIHISEAEAATTNVATLLAHVRAGAEVVIENDTRPVAVLRSAEPHPGRLLSESIALAEAHGSTVTLDGDFGHDLEAIINSHREPLNPPAWD